MNAEKRLLARLLEEAYAIQTWHGPNLRGSVRGVNAKEASWRPRRGRHNIREIVVHAAYWKYAVRRRLTGEKRGSFPLKGSNWFGLSGRGKEWKAEVALLDREHRALLRAVASLPASRLHRKAPGSKYEWMRMIFGVACHDVYHAGQIQLLKRLLRS